MNKSYIGACERRADKSIADGIREININWINLSTKEAGSGGADRITKKLLDAGYRPDGSGCDERVRADYESGKKVNGYYVRLPQETWILDGGVMERNKREDPLKRALLRDWDQVTKRVKEGLAIREHDIPIVGHSQKSDLEVYRKSRKAKSRQVPTTGKSGADD